MILKPFQGGNVTAFWCWSELFDVNRTPVSRHLHSKLVLQTFCAKDVLRQLRYLDIDFIPFLYWWYRAKEQREHLLTAAEATAVSGGWWLLFSEFLLASKVLFGAAGIWGLLLAQLQPQRLERTRNFLWEGVSASHLRGKEMSSCSSSTG